MEPREQLAAALEGQLLDQGVAANVYGAPPAGEIVTPCLVIRPDSPWRQPGRGQPFTEVEERYAVVAVVQAGGDGPSQVDALRRLVRLVEDVQDDGPWRWTETTGIAQVSQGGIDYLGSTVRISYLEG